MCAKKLTMQEDWNERARENAYFWVRSDNRQWNRENYYQAGLADVQRYVLPFFAQHAISRRQIAEFVSLDIGCGTGRVSRALSQYFGTVIGVDISAHMLAKAREDNADRPNIAFIQGSGTDLTGISSDSIDFCFSFLVFQHIPEQQIVYRYIADAMRVLRPNGLIKIQVRGSPGNPPGRVVWFRGFNHFYITLILWRGWLPVLWCRRYNTIYGACFRIHELQRILCNHGWIGIKLYYEDARNLWIEAKKPSSA